MQGKALEQRERLKQQFYDLYCCVDLAYRCFQYDYAVMGLSKSFGKLRISCFQQDALWFIEMPRVALVGIGSKPLEPACHL